MTIRTDKIALLIAEKIREVATRQGNVPFLTGDLRKSVIVKPDGPGRAVITSNLPYARAVHDGRPEVTIRPKRKKALYWKGAKHPAKKVVQPARKGKPFIKDAAREVINGDMRFLKKHIGTETINTIRRTLKDGLK